ncbi:MAG: hypothetical protein U0V75_09725 [Ferruginibacter sp.]
MVEIFKTDVAESRDAAVLLDALAAQLPDCAVNFDLEDCDRILRIQGDAIPVTAIREILLNKGFNCTLLD